jgi:hypothetical protein
MTILATIKNKTVECSSFQINHDINKAGTFDIEVATLDIFELGDLYLADVIVNRAGVIMARGAIKTPDFFPKFNSAVSSGSTVQLKCDTYEGLLLCEAGLDSAHFQDELVSVAIATLLNGAVMNTWVLGSTTTLTDTTITVDVRNKETLLPQIKAVLEESGYPTYYRYGGQLSTGEYILDIGSFGEKINSQYAILGDNILEAPRLKAQTREPLKRVYPVGGLSADAPLSLQDALNIDSTLSDASQDYQIIGNYVINNTIERGCNVKRDYDLQKTENDEAPTQAELNQAAHSMYKKVRKDMMASEPYITIDVKYTSELPPLIGSLMYVDGKVVEQRVDSINDRVTLHNSFYIRDWLRIMSVSGRFSERVANADIQGVNYSEIWQVELSTSDEKDVYTEGGVLSKDIENLKANKYDRRIGIAQGTNPFISSELVELTQTGVLPDCPSGGVNRKEFVLTAPTPPAGAIIAQATISSVTSGYEYVITQAGGLNIDLIICVNPTPGIDWTLLDTAQVQATWLFFG